MKTNKTWKLPKPVEIGGKYEWKPVVRVGTHVPFGYKQDPNDQDILLPIPEELELFEKAKKFISSSAVKAAYSMFEVMNNPTDLGNKEKMAAAKDVLDRSGFIKTEKVEVSAANPLFILPQKADEDE